MQIDRVQLRLRPRSPWEALDLGRVMVRAWAGPIYRAWATTYVPVAVALLAISPEWGPIAVWWVKPLFDRIVLFVCSRSVFDRPTTVGDVWRALPTLVRRTGLLAALTVSRLYPARSFVLPVRQLEGQRGRAARERVRVLAPGVQGYGVLLTMIGFVLSGVLTLSQIGLVEALWPVGESGFVDFAAWQADEVAWHVVFVIGLFGIVAETIVEPFYVASGFALYLNRRADLEAWDVELAFRDLAARRPHDAPRSRGPVVAAGLVLMVLLCSGSLVRAGEQGSGAEPKAGAPAPAAVIRDVLADPVFGKQVEDIEWRPRAWAPPSTSIPNWLKAIVRLMETIAGSARVIVWIAGACALAALLWWLTGHLERRRRAARASAPDMVFGLDVRPGSLPLDIGAAARKLVSDGRVTDALSLLYRGTLVELIHRAGVVFQEGDTEDDCLGRARPVLASPALGVLGAILDAWRLAAYGHRPPAGAEVLVLTDRWAEHFAPMGSRS